MELGDILGSGNMNWHVAVHPRASKALGPRVRNETLGYVSVDGIGWKLLPDSLRTLATEGMNEKGLTISANTLKMSVYESETSTKPKLLYWDTVEFVLSNFETVKEALAGLKKVAVVGSHKLVCDQGACFHWAIADATGNSAIIEFVKGEMRVKEGRKQHVGVMTNDPDLDWQQTNLNQYATVSPNWPDSNSIIQQHLDSGVFPKAVGHGANLLGLPGDATPVGRFVRMFYLREYALANLPEQAATKEAAIKLATGLLNNVYLVKGTVAKASMLDAWEYTPFAALKVPQDKLFMYRTASDMTWKQIALDNVNFTQPDHAKIQLSMDDLGIEDVTKLLSPSTPGAQTVI